MAVMIDRAHAGDQVRVMIKAILASKQGGHKLVWKRFVAPTNWLSHIPPTVAQLEVKTKGVHTGKVVHYEVSLSAKDVNNQPSSTVVGVIEPE